MTDARSEERGADVRLPPPLVFVIAWLLGALLRYAWRPLWLPAPWSVGIVLGLAFVAAAFALAASARKLMVRTGQRPAPWKPSPELILQGPYRFTRNPMYLGMTLLTIGLGLAFNNLWIALLAIPALVVIHVIAVMPEERYLSAKFGEPYIRYTRQVRRYI